MLDVKLDFFFLLNTFQLSFHSFSILIMLFKKLSKQVLLYKIFYCEKSGKSENPDMRSVSMKTQGCLLFLNLLI